jgi:Ser/Thr protein kinase RdoA (MazF antagonist)
MLVQPTDQGDLYLKATNPMFGPEPEITRLLAEKFPQNIPQVVAIDPRRKLTLMRDFQGERLAEHPDPQDWEIAVDAYASIQRHMEGYTADLEAIGCWNRHPSVLAAQIDDLLADTEPMLIGDPKKGLSQQEVDVLTKLAPRLKALCAELAESAIPPSIVHGDFHAMNTAIRGGVPVFFDWSDASVGHPFIDLVTLFEEGDMPPDVPGLRDIYLAHWRDCASEADLLRAYELAVPVALINMAISYRYIYRHQEKSARAELAGAQAYWLGKLVKLMQP